jgi:protein-ribulosamine 3-kinase
MIGEIPSFVQQQAMKILHSRKGEAVSIVHFSRSGGGCINHGGRLRTTDGDYFIKWNSATLYPGMFAAEAKGLDLLKNTNLITIPAVIGWDEDENDQFLLLEFVEGMTRSVTFWKDLGNRLATLHQVSFPEFGLDHDNYIGSLKQFNKPSTSWIDFFITYRIQTQLDIGLQSKVIDQRTAKTFERLFKKLPDLISVEKPSLIHGDLWNGNLMVDKDGGPCLIDPAVYYGHREVELAMTKLFGGFARAFYDSYNESFPLTPGYEERFDIYNLYPLLVHVNLFGGGYLQQINSILKKYN